MTGCEVAEECRLRLGVVWYMHTDEPPGGDAIGYLASTPENLREFRECDPALYLTLKKIVFKEERHIDSIQFGRVLPRDTLYYGRELSYPPYQNRPYQNRNARIALRNEWTEGAVNRVGEAQLVFVDPDTGINQNDIRYQVEGLKYTYCQELNLLMGKCRTLVIYHHLARNRGHDQQIEEMSNFLVDCLGPCTIWVLVNKYKGVGRSYFIIVPPTAEAHHIEVRLNSFRESLWFARGHFTWERPLR